MSILFPASAAHAEQLAKLSMLPLPLPEYDALTGLRLALPREKGPSAALSAPLPDTSCPLREDSVRECDCRDALIACIPVRADGFVVIASDGEVAT